MKWPVFSPPLLEQMFFSVNISVFLLKELFPDFSSLFTVSCLGYDVITLYQLCVSMCVCIIISGSYRE